MSRLIIFVALLIHLGAAGGLAAATGDTRRAASREEVDLLQTVLQKTADDLGRWAYNENRVVKDEKGKLKSEQVVRFDPSLPYPEQWTPITIDGREPTQRERDKFRRRGEDSDPAKPKRSSRFRRPALGEVIDVARTSVATESATHWVFEIPLLKVGNERFPPEKFQVHARVRKDGAQLENIAVSLRESFRSKLVMKVKSGTGSIDFAVVNPKFPPTMVAITGDASASVLFVSIGGSVDLKRTDLKHVKPFDERFEVQIGTLKALDF